MDELTSTTTGLVALGAAGVALVAFVWALVLAVKLRRVRSAQKAVLGPGDRDLVAHAEALQRDFDTLSAHVEDALAGAHQRLDGTEGRLDGTLAYRSLIRYDAYGEMSGHQSTTIALLDATRSGVILSSIHHRDSARLYAKQVRDGEAEQELSPEEDEAVRAALEPPARS
jgi:Protein of unknown function (DUF4446)